MEIRSKLDLTLEVARKESEMALLLAREHRRRTGHWPFVWTGMFMVGADSQRRLCVGGPKRPDWMDGCSLVMRLDFNVLNDLDVDADTPEEELVERLRRHQDRQAPQGAQADTHGTDPDCDDRPRPAMPRVANLPTLHQVLRDLSGLGWVHWYVDRGTEECYFPEEWVWHPDGHMLVHEREVDGLTLDLWVDAHGDRRFVTVETGSGLNVREDKELDRPRDDVRLRLQSIPGWFYIGSGTYTREVAPTPTRTRTPGRFRSRSLAAKDRREARVKPMRTMTSSEIAAHREARSPRWCQTMCRRSNAQAGRLVYSDVEEFSQGQLLATLRPMLAIGWVAAGPQVVRHG